MIEATANATENSKTEWPPIDRCDHSLSTFRNEARTILSSSISNRLRSANLSKSIWMRWIGFALAFLLIIYQVQHHYCRVFFLFLSFALIEINEKHFFLSIDNFRRFFLLSDDSLLALSVFRLVNMYRRKASSQHMECCIIFAFESKFIFDGAFWAK